jgi:hypothetical protein
MEVLCAKPYIELQARGGPRLKQPAHHWDKPVVVLTNERSFSDAEVFPWCFQTAGRGKVVGVATPGGVIGTTDVELSDGSKLRIPRVGWWGVDGTKLEGRGVQPDVVVCETCEDRLEGRDPQLAKAIEIVNDEIDAARRAARTPAPGPRPEAPRPAGAEPEAPAPEPTTPEPAPRPDPATDTGPATGAEPPAAQTPRAEEAAPPDPWRDVEVGEWIRFRNRVQGTDTVVLQRVVEVTEEEVVLETVVRQGETVMPASTLRRPRAPRAGGRRPAERTVERATLTVGGRDLACVLVTSKGRRGTTVREWTCDEVAASGLVRRERDGEVVAEVVDWGGPGTAPSAP